MKKIIALALVTSSAVAAFVFAGCSSGDNGNGGTDSGTDATATDSGDAGGGGNDSSTGKDSTTSDSGGGGMDSGTPDTGNDSGAFPAPPTLGTEIDRLGRPAVNTALNHVFDTDAGAKGAAKDTYNADNMTANWTTYMPEFKKNLAVFDGLDTVCGNQTAYAGSATTPDYTLLSTVLSGDALWLNTSTTTCNQYLGVEIKVLDTTAPTDCGGRTLTENVVDTTYNAVAGTLHLADGGVSQGPLTNGITAPGTGQVGNGTFPYLAAPHGTADAGAPDSGSTAEDSGTADTGAADTGADVAADASGD